MNDVLLFVVVAAALAFDFTNGFHDTANAMATTIATRALPAKQALGLAASLNFVGAFLSISVAATIAEGIVDQGQIALPIIFAGLLGAIGFNLTTWYLGLPSSSSHALIGGMVGAMLAGVGTGGVEWSGILEKVLIPGVFAVLIAGGVAVIGTKVAYLFLRNIGTDMATRGYRLGQIGSASLVSLGHGTNDAQKTMGIIVLALVANGNLSGEDFTVPLWVKVTCATAIALGTFMGGWRIIGTLGKKVAGDITPPQGFSAEASGATLILGSSYFGYPLSTTQVVSGAVVGSGLGRGESRVNWGIAGRMGIAWALTLPGSAAVAAAAYGIVSVLGDTAGPVVVGTLALAGAIALFLKTRREDSSNHDLNDLKAVPA
ncbi:inorganic phosphate transporter [Solirubrobacter taibaiensis]|nr:inorganic phosphate transporter [Solirubrobacter taibaiensis]